MKRQPNTTTETIPVNVCNFIRAETDLYFSRTVEQGGFGKLVHELQQVIN